MIRPLGIVWLGSGGTQVQCIKKIGCVQGVQISYQIKTMYMSNLQLTIKLGHDWATNNFLLETYLPLWTSKMDSWLPTAALGNWARGFVTSWQICNMYCQTHTPDGARTLSNEWLILWMPACSCISNQYFAVMRSCVEWFHLPPRVSGAWRLPRHLWERWVCSCNQLEWSSAWTPLAISSAPLQILQDKIITKMSIL